MDIRSMQQNKTRDIFRFIVDRARIPLHTISRTRRYLSWIEGLTTNQNVTGSNPVRRTSLIYSGPAGPFFLDRCFIYSRKLTQYHY